MGTKTDKEENVLEKAMETDIKDISDAKLESVEKVVESKPREDEKEKGTEDQDEKDVSQKEKSKVSEEDKDTDTKEEMKDEKSEEMEEKVETDDEDNVNERFDRMFEKVQESELESSSLNEHSEQLEQQVREAKDVEKDIQERDEPQELNTAKKEQDILDLDVGKVEEEVEKEISFDRDSQSEKERNENDQVLTEDIGVNEYETEETNGDIKVAELEVLQIGKSPEKPAELDIKGNCFIQPGSNWISFPYI